MTRAFIDMTALTSALGAVKQGSDSSLSKTHDQNLVEVTYFLLHDEMRVIPHPGNSGGEVGDVANFFSVLPEVTTKIPAAKQTRANLLAKEWLDNHTQLLSTAWQNALKNEALWDWAVPQRDLRWIEHSQTYGALFDKTSIEYMSPLLDFPEEGLRRIYDTSTIPTEVGRWLKEGGEDAEVAIKAWVLGWLIRGKYYEHLAIQAKMQLFPHPLRCGLENALEPTTSQQLNRSEELFIRMIIGSAQVETSPPRRVAAWAENIQLGRKAIHAKAISLPQTVTEAEAERFAARAAKDAGIAGRAKIYRDLMKYGLDVGGHTALAFSLASWVPLEAIPVINAAAHLGYRQIRGRDPGEDAARLAFDTKSRFRWLSKLPSGRIERDIGSIQEE